MSAWSCLRPGFMEPMPRRGRPPGFQILRYFIDVIPFVFDLSSKPFGIWAKEKARMTQTGLCQLRSPAGDLPSFSLNAWGVLPYEIKTANGSASNRHSDPVDGAYKPQKRHPKSRDNASVSVCNANPIAPRLPEQPALPLKEKTHMNHSKMIIPQYIVDVNRIIPYLVQKIFSKIFWILQKKYTLPLIYYLKAITRPRHLEKRRKPITLSRQSYRSGG